MSTSLAHSSSTPGSPGGSARRGGGGAAGGQLAVVNDLLASANIFASAVNDLMAAELQQVAGDRLTFAQLKVLRLLARSDSLSVSDVGGLLRVSSAAASKAVDRLVRSRLLKRAEDKADRRALEVSLTDDARRLLAEYEAAAAGALTRLFGDVPARRLREITNGLDRLSVSVVDGNAPGVCFRCGVYFRERCLLRTATPHACYLHLRTAGRGFGRVAGARAAERREPGGPGLGETPTGLGADETMRGER